MEIDIELFKKPLGAWFNKLSPFFNSKYGEELYGILKKRGSAGHKIFPFPDRTYKAFELTAPEDVKCILIGMSPYPTKGKNGMPSADGLLFSNSLTKEISPSLSLFYEAMEKDLNRKVDKCYDLSYLAKQGVLLLNASLTTEFGKPDIHNQLGVWDNFNKFLYGGVLDSFCGIPVVTIGKEAKRIEKHLFGMCHIIKNIEHPAFAARQHREWECENVFSWINKIIKENNGEFAKIYWDKFQYDDMQNDTPPWD